MNRPPDGSPFNWRDHLKVHPAAELFPLLPPDEVKALADDIQKNRMQTPIVLWRECSGASLLLLDGRNRLDALALSGCLRPRRDRAPREKMGVYMRCVQDRPLQIVDKDDDCIGDLKTEVGGDPYDIVLSLNVHRRHLTAEQKRELIAKVLKAKPEQSNRAIAKQVKVDHKTVADVRSKAVSTGEIPQLTETVGIDGKKRGAQKALQTRIEKEKKRKEIFYTPVEKLSPEQKKWSIHDGLSQFHRQAAEARATATRHNHLKGVTAEDVKLATSVALAWMTLADIFKDRVVAADSAEEMKGKFASLDEAAP